MRRAPNGSLLLVLSLAHADALAVDLSAIASYSGEYTTNSARSQEGENEYIHRPALVVGLEHDGTSLDANANYHLSRRIHGDDQFENETISTGAGELYWTALPDRLFFTAANSRTDTTVDSRLANNPDNRQTISYSTLGSTLRLRGFANHFIDAGYTIGWTDAEETQTDSQRQTGSLVYGIPLSPIRQLSLLGSYANVDFDEPASQDYDATNVSVQYTSSTRVLDLGVTLGYQSTQPDSDAAEINGYVGSIDARMMVGGSNALSVNASRSIQDNFDGGALGITDIVEDVLDRTDTTEIYTQDQLAVSYEMHMGVNDVTFSGSWGKRNFEYEAEDEEHLRASFDLHRSISHSSTIGVGTTWEERQFDTSSREDTIRRTHISYSTSPSRILTLRFGVNYTERDSESALASYDAWVSTVTIDLLLYGRSTR